MKKNAKVLNSQTCGFGLVTRGLEHVTRKDELITREFELVDLNSRF